MKLNQPDWSDNSRSFAFCAELPKYNLIMHLIFSAHWETLDFGLPPLADGISWRRWIDTSLPSPDDICDWDAVQSIAGFQPGSTYSVGPRSVVVLQADIA